MLKSQKVLSENGKRLASQHIHVKGGVAMDIQEVIGIIGLVLFAIEIGIQIANKK